MSDSSDIKLLNKIFNISRAGIMSFDAVRDRAGNIVDFEWNLCNEAGAALAGSKVEDLVGKRLLEVMPGNRETGLFDRYVEVTETGIRQEFEFLYSFENVDEIWFKNIVVKNNDGFIVHFENITDEKTSSLKTEKAKEQLETVLNSASNSMYLVDVLGPKQFVFKACNDQFHFYTQTNKEEVIDKDPISALGNVLGTLFIEELESCRSTKIGSHFSTRSKIHGDDGFFEIQHTPIIENNEVVRIVSSSRDITKEVKYRKSFEEEKYLLNLLMDTSVDDFYFKDTNSKFIRINRATAQKLGIENPEIAIGKTDHDFFSKEIADRTRADEIKILSTGEPIISKDEIGIKKDSPDKILWGSTTKLPMRDPNGKIVGLFGITRDITEKKLAEQKLKSSEERFRSLAENIIDVILQIDESGTIEYVSPSVNKMLGYTPSFLIGMNAFDLINHDDFLREVLPQLEDIDSKSILKPVEVRTKNAKGNYIWMSFVSKLITSPDGKLSILSVGRDIDEKKQAVDDLKASNFQKDNLFSIISHDLRNPIGNFLSLSETIVDSLDDYSRDELIRFIKMIRSNALDANLLLDDLMAWVRTQFQNVTVENNQININLLFKRLQKYVESKLLDKNIEFILDNQISTIFISDEKILELILRNFLINACKFSHKGKKIYFRAFEKNNNIHLAIQDEGVGLSESQIHTLLKTNEVKTSRGTSGESGTGLGFQICKNYSQYINAQIEIVSQPEEGSTITLVFPLKTNEVSI